MLGWASVGCRMSGNILDMVLIILLLLLGNGGMAALLVDGLIVVQSVAVTDGWNADHLVSGLTESGAHNILIWAECRSSCFWVDQGTRLKDIIYPMEKRFLILMQF